MVQNPFCSFDIVSCILIFVSAVPPPETHFTLLCGDHFFWEVVVDKLSFSRPGTPVKNPDTPLSSTFYVYWNCLSACLPPLAWGWTSVLTTVLGTLGYLILWSECHDTFEGSFLKKCFLCTRASCCVCHDGGTSVPWYWCLQPTVPRTAGAGPWARQAACSARKQPVHCSVPYKDSHLLCVLEPEDGWEALVSANRSLQ